MPGAPCRCYARKGSQCLEGDGEMVVSRLRAQDNPGKIRKSLPAGE